MNNKLTNVLLVVLIILVIVIGYIIISKPKVNDVVVPNQIENSQTSQNTITPITQPIKTNWKALSNNELLNIFSKEADVYFEKDSGLSVSQEIDLTGDGINEGIVVGNGGNNNISFILMKDTNGTTVVAKQKNKDGTVSIISLLEVGRVMVQERYELLPNENGFYTASLSNDQNVSNFKCNKDGVNAYVWNQQTMLFEWNQQLTTKYTTQVCK